MTTIDDIVYYADGSKANGQVMVSWPLFQYNGTAVVAGQETYPIVDGQLQITLYANINSLPTGTYYTAAFELEEGAREIEYWIVPNLPVVTLSQIRATFPPAPGLLINALQLSGGGAQPGQVLGWNGSQWVPMYVTTINVSPNTIGLNVTAAVASDISVSGTPATLGTSLTLNIPDAGSSSRGAVTAGVQSIGGVKTFLAQVNFTTVTQYSAYAGVSSVFGSVYFDTAKHFHMWGSVTLQTPDSTLAILQADGAQLKHVDLSGGAVGTAALPGGAVTIPGMESILLPTGPNYTHGLGVDGAGNLWLGTASPTASFAYLRPDQAWVANWVDLSPYQHPSLPNTEVTPNAASIVLYKDATQWAGIGYDQNMRMWFRLGPNASGTYYYLGANQVSFANANYYVNSVLIGHRAGVNLIASSNVTLSGGDNPSNNRVDVVIAASGSLVDPTTTLGDFIVRGSAALNRLGVGSDGEVLTADSSQLLGVRWAVAGAATGGVPSTRQVIAGPGLYGGGELIADVTLGALVQSVFGRTGNIVLTGPDITAAGGVLQTRKILTGVGLAGGGDLSADRTLIGVVMGASGASHALGMVPDPGATAGVTHYLREDATWVVPPLGLADPTTSVGDLIVRGSPVIARLPVGANGQVLTADSAQTLGVKWATVAAGFVSPLTTKGDVMVYDTATTRLPVGSNGQVLTADSTQAPGLRWGAASTSFWVGGTGGAIYYNGGNVGIGTATPQAQLDIWGPGSAPGAATGSGYAGLRISNPGAGNVLEAGAYPASPYGMWIQAGNRITPATYQPLILQPLGGNVGVGTATPGALLDVAGYIRSTGAVSQPTTGAGVEILYGAPYGYIAVYDRGASVYKSLRIDGLPLTLNAASGSGVGVGIAPVGSYLQVHEGANQNVVFATSNGFTALQATNDAVNALVPMVYSASGHYFMQGNVGIGTTSPSSKLSFGATDPSVGSRIAFFENPGGVSFRGIGMVSTGTSFGVGIWASTSLAPTNANMQLFVQDGGNVGSGTTSPAGQLTVSGMIPVPPFTTSTNMPGTILVDDMAVNVGSGGAIVFSAGGQAWKFAAIRGYTTNGGGNSQGDITFLTRRVQTDTTLTEAMRINSAGLVGIGTGAGGTQKLSVMLAGGVFGTVLGLGVNGVQDLVQIGYDSTGFSFFQGSANSATQIKTQNNQNLHLLPGTGNVGVGTAAPNGRLHVSGGYILVGSGASAVAAGDIGISRESAPTTGAMYFGNGGTYIYYNGSAWTFNPALPGGSGQPQTPWAQDIVAQNHSLTGGNIFTITTLNATNISAATGIAIGPVAVPAGIQMTVDYAVKSATPNWTVGSDMRTKQNVHELEGGLDVIRRLPPILVAEYNGLAHTPKDLRVVSFDLEKLREVLPYTVGSHRTKLREEDAEETDILHYNIHEVVMHLILAVKQLAEKN